MEAKSAAYSGIVFRMANADDDDAIKRLLRKNPMEAWVSLAFEREPSYFSGEDLMGRSYCVVAHNEDDHKEFMGMYSCAFIPVRVNGKAETAGYLGGLRIAAPYRNKFRYVKNGYDSITRIVPDKSTTEVWFTSIANDNNRARKLLESGLKGLPGYFPVGNMKTIAISTRQARNNHILQQVTADDIDELISFYHKQTANYQFAPVLTENWLSKLCGDKGLTLGDFYVVRSNGIIVGCLALWDQRGFKQVVIKDYRFPLNKLRTVYNIFSYLRKQMTLPEIGKKLEQVYISFVAFTRESSDLVVPALQDALYKIGNRGAEMAVLGLSVENPLVKNIESGFRIQVYETCIEMVKWNPAQAVSLASNNVQPEIAIL